MAPVAVAPVTQAQHCFTCFNALVLETTLRFTVQCRSPGPHSPQGSFCPQRAATEARSDLSVLSFLHSCSGLDLFFLVSVKRDKEPDLALFISQEVRREGKGRSF